MNAWPRLAILTLALAPVTVGCGGIFGTPAPQPDPGMVLGDARFRVTVRTDQALHEQFGPRFDATGYVSSVAVDGQEFLGPFGLSGEFGIHGLGVLGYDQAREGGEFVKIGVGRLRRLDDKPYLFTREYPIAQRFPVRIERGMNTVTFTQEGRLGAWGYRYRKRYRIEPTAGAVLVEYELANTGTKPFAFEHYNHNWIRFGSGEVATGYYVRPGFGIVPDIRKQVVLWGNEMRLPQHADGAYLTSAETAPAETNRLLIGFYGGRQSVQITNDFPLARFALVADQRGICPETFFQRTLPPVSKCTWKRVYVFQLEDK